MRIRPLLVPDIGQTRPDLSTTRFFAKARCIQSRDLRLLQNMFQMPVSHINLRQLSLLKDVIMSFCSTCTIYLTTDLFSSGSLNVSSGN